MYSTADCGPRTAVAGVVEEYHWWPGILKFSH